MTTLPIRFTRPSAELPTRAHPTDAGLDLRASTRATIPSGGRAVLQRAADEGRVQAIAALGVTLIHRDEIPRLRLAAHDTRQDERLKGL